MNWFQWRSKVLVITAVLIMLLPLLAACGAKTASQLMVKNNVKAADFTALTVLSRITGKVLVSRTGEGKWIVGQDGMILDTGAKIKTSPGGKAAITFFDGTTLDLNSETEVTLEEIKPESKSSSKVIRIRQQIGETTSRVIRLTDPASRYEIETPAAIVGVRGSVMVVKVSPDGATNVHNIQGNISVKAQGKEVPIPAGSSSTVRIGEAPGAPQPGLLPKVEAADPNSISSQSGWQQTALQLKAGEKFSVEYRGGRWSVDYRNFPYVGPEGYTESVDKTIAAGYKFEPAAPYGYLLGKIGEGKVFQIGSSGQKLSADATGYLYLRINDKDLSLWDNDGSIIVSLKTGKP